MQRRTVAVVGLVLAFAAGACGSEAPVTASPGASGSPSASGTAPVISPTPAPGAASPSDLAPTPALTPSAPPATSPAPSSTADACSGSADNRAFFATLAGLVSWPVYCAALPAGWFVQGGDYELTAGGWSDVTYKGPGGVHLQVKEGNFCTGGASACPAAGLELGPTAFGDQTGTLVSLGPGFAVYVNAGGAPAWSAATVDLDQAAFVLLVAALHRVTP